MSKLVCFDIGCTNVKYGLLSKKGEILDKNLFKTDIHDEKYILGKMCEVIEEYKNNYEICGISIGSPGFINKDTGEIINGTLIKGFIGFNIRNYFENKYNLKVAVENDANCATIAEHMMGNGVGSKNMVCLTIGTGVGGGIIIDNKLYNGSTFMSGEFGFTIINGIEHDILDRHLFSDYASTRSLIERTSEKLGEDIDGISIFERAKNGDKICKESISYFYDNLAIGVYNLAYILNPDKILLGGAISQQMEIINEIKLRIDKFTPSYSRNLNEYLTIDRCKFLNDAGLIGSCCNFIYIYD